MNWDIFISHASEDKKDFVRPLAKYLRGNRIKVWYDEFTLKIGDSLREKIDDGIKKSKFGIIVLSPNFLKKKWTKKELIGLFSKEIYSNEDILIPIWLNITPEQIFEFSPMLSDKVGLVVNNNNVIKIGENIVKRIIHNLASKETVEQILSSFENMNKFDLQNKISEINFRLTKLYNYLREMEAIDIPDSLLESEDNEKKIEEFIAPFYESIEKKYDFPNGMWTEEPIFKFEFDYIKKNINKWVRGRMTMKECDDYFFQLDFMINTDILYIFFGLSNFSIEDPNVDLREDFYKIGTRNIV